jgi:hypothetical protein
LFLWRSGRVRMAQPRERILTRKEAARFMTQHGFTIAAQTLARLFSEGRGPQCIHMGRRAKYRESDLMDYMLSKTSAPRRSPREPLRPINAGDFPLAAADAGDSAALEKNSARAKPTQAPIKKRRA